MTETLLTMLAGIVLWAALAPTRWQEALQELVADAVELVRAWAVELYGKVRR